MDQTAQPQTEQRAYSLDELQHYVVAAALVDTDLLEQVMAKFMPRLTGELASLFQAASAYYNITRGCLTREALISILSNNEPDISKHERYLALYDSLVGPPYSEIGDPERRWFLHQYDLEWQRNWTGMCLARAAEAMREGIGQNGTKVVGADAAWQVIAEARIEFENHTSGGVLNDAEVTANVDHARRDYETAKHSEYKGLPLAIPEVQTTLRGIRAGELLIVTAYASEGKSFFMLNDAYEAWRHGHNVAVATGEMTYDEYRYRLMALHSCDPKFPHPILTTEIEDGSLSDEDEKIYWEVLEDFATNPQYGKFFIFQFPRRATPDMIFNKFAAYDQIAPLDMGVVDYLGLMGSSRSRVQRREELDDLIREVKSMALDFADGRGLAVEAGYQTNRTSYMQALSDGYYTLSCFAESSEAEKSANKALWLLRMPQNPTEIKAGVIKNRGGELGEPFYMQENYKHAQLASLRRSSAGSQGQPAATSVGDALLDIGG